MTTTTAHDPSRYSGILDMRGQLSVGCALTVGVKHAQKGYPIEKDRFHIVWPEENDQERRPYHPRFEPFNTAPPEARRAVFGTIMHATRAECFDHSLWAQAPKGEQMPPSRRPFCRGNGEVALRFQGIRDGEEVFEEIECPNDRCRFRQPVERGKPGCGPHMRFLFMLQWSERSPLPSMLCKFTSGGWNTTNRFKGFFKQVEAIAAAYGLQPDQVNWTGLRFVLQLSERTNKEKRSRYPVVSITAIDNIADFLQRQSQRALQIGGQRPVALLDDSQQAGPVTSGDWGAHEREPAPRPGAIDAQAAPAAPVAPEPEPAPAPEPPQPQAVELAPLDQLLADEGLGRSSLALWRRQKNKPPVESLDPQQREQLATWLRGEPDVIAEIRALDTDSAPPF